MVSKIFVDANVILDYSLKRSNYLPAREIFDLADKSKIKLFMSSSVVHVVGYFLSKYLGKQIAKITLQKLLEHIKVVDGDHQTVELALKSHFTDIEDALQYYIAVKNRMNYFITFDNEFCKNAIIDLPIINAIEFAKLISGD